MLICVAKIYLKKCQKFFLKTLDIHIVSLFSLSNFSNCNYYTSNNNVPATIPIKPIIDFLLNFSFKIK